MLSRCCMGGVEMDWNAARFGDALQREAVRLFEGADYLTPVERDTYVRAIEMIRHFVLLADEFPMGRSRHMTDEELQPLRDWLAWAGRWDREGEGYKRFGGIKWPSFMTSTAAENPDGVIPFPRR